MRGQFKRFLGSREVQAEPVSPLDLKEFTWVKDKAGYQILAITTFLEHDVVVYQSLDTKRIEISTIDQFCREYQAIYDFQN